MSTIVKNYLAQMEIDLQDPYYAQFGRFIVAYSQIEGSVRDALTTLLNLSIEESAAIFHQIGITDSIAAINRILAARDDTITNTKLQIPFKQIQIISEMRNALVHWGAELNPKIGFTVSNPHKAHIPSKIKEHRISIVDLAAMTSDLMKADVHIIAALHWGELTQDSIENFVTPMLTRAWRYKPPQPTPPDKAPSPKRLQ